MFIDGGYLCVQLPTALEPEGGSIKPLTDVAVILKAGLLI